MEEKFETRNTSSEENLSRRIVVVIFSLLEVILGFRFFFKLIGANPTNIFVKSIYAITQLIVGIFEGIFSMATTTGAEVTAVFEPATLIAIIVVALIAWGVLTLMAQSTSKLTQKTKVSDNTTDLPK